METLKSNKARLEYLINDMHRERNDNDVLVMPSSFEDLWELYRGLANVRPALPVSDEYLAVQDAMLSDLNRQHVTDLKDLKPIKGDNIFVWQGDITTLKIDAIVNAANSRFLGCMQANHDCIDNIIHTKAGVQVRLDCAEIIRQQGRNEGVGKAKITRGYNLSAKYIIHTVGPQIRRLPVSKMNQDLLAKCYLSCLKLADQHSLNHVAFCCISTGVFAFPQDEADAIVIGIGAGMSASDGFTYVGERFTENFPDFIENIASLICCKRVYILMAVGKSIGHLRVVLLH